MLPDQYGGSGEDGGKKQEPNVPSMIKAAMQESNSSTQIAGLTWPVSPHMLKSLSRQPYIP